MHKQPTIGIIGGGNMGRCIIGGLIQKGYPNTAIMASDHHVSHCKVMEKKWGIATYTDNQPVIETADIVILAVKPHAIAKTLRALQTSLQTKTPILISVAAAITTSQIRAWSGLNASPILRAMPNTPALIGQGITALFTSDPLQTTTQQQISQIFESLGEIVWVESEEWLDIITALSGSGPAYFFALMESLIDGAIQLGLPAEMARQLTVATAVGSAHLAKSAHVPLATLRQQVTSKGGTTEQALQVLETGQFHELVQKALTAATKHSQKLTASFD